MKKIIIFNFDKINSEKMLFQFIEDELKLSKYIEWWNWWKNLDWFFDLFWYSNDEVIFVIKNLNSIKDDKFKKFVYLFIDVLDRLKWLKDVEFWEIPNPNFDYIIKD